MAPRLSGTDTTPAVRPEAVLAGMARAQAELLRRSDDVGDRFAREARAIHDGDRPERAIHGRATMARSLADDGIPVMPLPLPLPIRSPGTEN